jgi:hypothetical protein
VTGPSGCRWCGVTKPDHASRWNVDIGWHQWTQPTQQQIKDRMRARRAERTSP